MIDHLRAGDADGAERVARRHVETFRAMMMERAMTMEKVIASPRESKGPAMPGDPRRVGSMVKFGGQSSVSEAKILDAEGKLLASGGVDLTAPAT